MQTGKTFVEQRIVESRNDSFRFARIDVNKGNYVGPCTPWSADREYIHRFKSAYMAERWEEAEYLLIVNAQLSAISEHPLKNQPKFFN